MCSASADDNSADAPGQSRRELPDWFGPVAEDVIRYCRPKPGLWVDIGSGPGGLGLALAGASRSACILIEPDSGDLERAVEKAGNLGLGQRVIPIVGRAEKIPLPDSCVDLVASRGSIFYWGDPAEGLREVYRILRPGARALIGGGFGTSYPAWAYEEFMARQRGHLAAEGEEALRAWDEPRSLESLRAAARAAGIEEALIDETPPGNWLLFEKRGK
ncbi:MAG: class I SAM-dependent methyltransferase [Planctomycetes bacterium]|nr:class I SAM-dependent methyltransferase [Planctomycetota bacterium]